MRPPEVHTPRGAFFIVLQFGQRYSKFSGPVVCVLLYLCLPRGVPGKGEGTLVADALVHLRCERVDAEDVGIAVVVVGVENDLDGVVVPDPRVAARQGFAQSGHIWLPTAEADIDRHRIVENECLGAQSCGHAAILLSAEEVPGYFGLLPSGLGEVTVNLRWLIDAQGHYSARGVVR